MHSHSHTNTVVDKILHPPFLCMHASNLFPWAILHLERWLTHTMIEGSCLFSPISGRVSGWREKESDHYYAYTCMCAITYVIRIHIGGRNNPNLLLLWQICALLLASHDEHTRRTISAIQHPRSQHMFGLKDTMHMLCSCSWLCVSKRSGWMSFFVHRWAELLPASRNACPLSILLSWKYVLQWSRSIQKQYQIISNITYNI